MTHAEATEPRTRLLVDRRPRPAAARPSRRERLVARLGYRVYEPPRGPEVDFLASAPELAGAIRSGHARFTHVALAGWLGCTDSDPYERDTVRAQYASLLADFEREAGSMCRWYFGRTKLIAAALTDDDALSVLIGRDVETGRPELVDLVRCCQRIGYQAWHRLAPYDRRLCQHIVFSVIEEAFRMLEADPANEDATCVEALAGRLREAEQFMLRCAARRAQSHYLIGVLRGAAAIAAVLAVVTVGLQVGGELSRFRGTLLLVAMAGAVGAAISVPMRMTSGSFRMNLPTLNAEMKGTDLHLVGALRPAMGLVLALASYAVVLAGLVPMDKNADDPGKQMALYVALAFLAGFTERFAQDMFVRSGMGLQGVMGDSPTTGPSAGLAPPPGARAGGAPAA
jgi:hypothetical protein